MSNLLQVNDIKIEFKAKDKNIRAVTGVSFSVDRGQTLGIVGESGAGKSVLGLSILRLLPDATVRIPSGEVIFDGTDLLELPMDQMRKIRGKRISMIFQDPVTALNPVMTIGDQIFESLQFHNTEKMSRKALHQRVDTMLELVGIPSYRKSEYPYQFSGGMQQRIVIAIALVNNPELVIADEPTTALDVTIQAQILAIMRSLQKKLDTAMVLITHDLGVVAKMCDKVAIMYAGEIVESGSIEDFFGISSFHHPYTVGLLGCLPDLRKKSDRLTPINGMMPDPTKLPEGCRFHPRCPHTIEICKSVPPVTLSITSEHKVACHLFGGGV